jgi:hypothetical protein
MEPTSKTKAPKIYKAKGRRYFRFGGKRIFIDKNMTKGEVLTYYNYLVKLIEKKKAKDKKKKGQKQKQKQKQTQINKTIFQVPKQGPTAPPEDSSFLKQTLQRYMNAFPNIDKPVAAAAPIAPAPDRGDATADLERRLREQEHEAQLRTQQQHHELGLLAQERNFLQNQLDNAQRAKRETKSPSLDPLDGLSISKPEFQLNASTRSAIGRLGTSNMVGFVTEGPKRPIVPYTPPITRTPLQKTVLTPQQQETAARQRATREQFVRTKEVEAEYEREHQYADKFLASRQRQLELSIARQRHDAQSRELAREQAHAQASAADVQNRTAAQIEGRTKKLARETAERDAQKAHIDREAAVVGDPRNLQAFADLETVYKGTKTFNQLSDKQLTNVIRYFNLGGKLLIGTKDAKVIKANKLDRLPSKDIKTLLAEKRKAMGAVKPTEAPKRASVPAADHPVIRHPPLQRRTTSGEPHEHIDEYEYRLPERVSSTGSAGSNDELIQDEADTGSAAGPAGDTYGFGHVKASDGIYGDQINKIMDVHKQFIGTVAVDELPSLLPYVHKNAPIAFIVNLDKHTQPGSHWCSVYIDPVNSKSVEWFNSYGEAPPLDVLKGLKALIRKMDPAFYLTFKINRVVHQNEKSSNCGYFAMQFLLERMRGKSFADATGFNDEKKINESAQYEKQIEQLKKVAPFKFIDHKSE